MKKILSVLILLSLFFFPDFAQATSRQNTIITKVQTRIEAREERLNQIRERVENRIQTKTASKAGVLTQIRQTNIKKYYTNMSDRLWALSERLDVLISRIEARVKILENQTDNDLTEIRSEIDKAKSLQNDTKALIVSSDAMIDQIVTSNDPSSSFSILKENIYDINNNFKEVKRILVSLIGDVQGLSTKTLLPTLTPSSI